MLKFATGIAVGAVAAWFVTADHYGKILRGGSLDGVMCRVHGLSGVLYGPFGDTEMICADLTGAIPEKVLWDELLARLQEQWGEG